MVLCIETRQLLNNNSQFVAQVFNYLIAWIIIGIALDENRLHIQIWNKSHFCWWSSKKRNEWKLMFYYLVYLLHIVFKFIKHLKIFLSISLNHFLIKKSNCRLYIICTSLWSIYNVLSLSHVFFSLTSRQANLACLGYLTVERSQSFNSPEMHKE